MSGTKLIADALHFNHSLKHLDLSCKFLFFIFTAKIHLSHYHLIIVIGNALCNPGGEAIGLSLVVNRSLTYLDLSCSLLYI